MILESANMYAIKILKLWSKAFMRFNCQNVHFNMSSVIYLIPAKKSQSQIIHLVQENEQNFKKDRMNG